MHVKATAALTLRGACLLAGLTFSLDPVCADGRVDVSVNDAAVTIEADDASIRSVLESLSTKIELEVSSASALDERLTMNIDSPNVQEAIGILLRGRSYLLLWRGYGTNSNSQCVTKCGKLWVFSDGSGDNIDNWSQTPAKQESLFDDVESTVVETLAVSAHHRDREEAMFDLGEISGEVSARLLRRGLSDANDKVREAAIDSLGEVGGSESMLALGAALNDPEARLRINALDALGAIGGEESIELLRQALSDNDSTVREAAAEWLTELTWRQ